MAGSNVGIRTLTSTHGASTTLDHVTGTAQTTLGGLTKRALDVTISSGLIDFKWDFVTQTQASTTDTWTFKTGGSGGATVGVVVITYVDSSKAVISTVARTT